MLERKRDRRNVYFITDGAAVKIGYSAGVGDRLNNLQSSTHSDLRLLADFPGDYADEQALHHHFADLNIRGEWFRADPAIDEMIAGLEAARMYLGNRTLSIADVVAGKLKPDRGYRPPQEILAFRHWYKEQHGKFATPEIERVACRCFLDSALLIQNDQPLFAKIAAKEFAQLGAMLAA